LTLSNRLAILLAGGLSAGLFWACIPEPTIPDGPVTGSAHVDFPLVGSHLPVDCEDCHIAGAAEQGLASGFESGWVDELSMDCLGCHVDTREAYYPNFNHGNGATCSADGGCHSVTDNCWREVAAACLTPPPTPPTGEPTPPPPGHNGELALRFPLEGPHGGTACTACHPGAFDEQVGGANACESCHPRALPDGPGDGHYPPQNLTAGDGARGCKACHAAEGPDETLIVPPDWAAGGVVHDFHWPHNGADACLDCHLTPGSQTATDYTCTSGCHDDLSAADYHADPNGPCADCHQRGN
jgi:hypothetical protein